MGGPGGDALVGNEGDDVLDGGPGDDYLEGIGPIDAEEANTAGNDRYIGGGGIDSLTYGGRTDDLTLSPDGVANDGAAGETDDIAPDVRAISGGHGNDILVGNDDRNDLAGLSGDDVMVGAAGDDQLAGGGGNDQLGGGDGGDVLEGDDGDDVIVGGAGADRFWGDTVLGCIALSCASGRDEIAARDGIAEPVNCGPGEDAVEIDAERLQPGRVRGRVRVHRCTAGVRRGKPAAGRTGRDGRRRRACARAGPRRSASSRASARRGGRIVVRLAVPAPGGRRRATLAAAAR